MRFIITTIFVSFALVSCSEATVTAPTQPPKPVVQPISDTNDRNKTCGADSLQHLVGQLATQLDAMSFTQQTRIIKPGMPITRDLRRDRLNFEIDENGLIIKISCF